MLFQSAADNDLPRYLLANVILCQKGGHYLLILLTCGYTGKKQLVPQISALPDKKQLNTGDPPPAGAGDDIQITAFAADVLSLLDPAQAGNLIPETGCLLELKGDDDA